MKSKGKKGIGGIELNDWKSFKTLDRVNRNLWGERWKERVGAENLRGWNGSPEYRRYMESKENRLETWAERNPKNFFENVGKGRAEGTPKVDRATGLRPMFVQEQYSELRGYGSITELISDIQYLRGIAAARGLEFKVVVNYKDDTGTGKTFTVVGEEKAVQELAKMRGNWAAEMTAQAKAGNQKSNYGLIQIDGELSARQTESSFIVYADVDASIF